MIAHVLRRAENPAGGCGDLFERGPVGEDHDLVEKVWTFRTPEESGAPGLGEEEEAGESGALGGNSEEWEERGGRHVFFGGGVFVWWGWWVERVEGLGCGGGSLRVAGVAGHGVSLGNFRELDWECIWSNPRSNREWECRNPNTQL